MRPRAAFGADVPRRLLLLRADRSVSVPFQFLLCLAYNAILERPHIRKLKVDRPNQVSVKDITYVPVARVFVYFTAAVFGSCIRRRSSSLTAWSFACMRSPRDFRWSRKLPRRLRPQMKVKKPFLSLNLLQQNVHFVRLGMFRGQWKELFQRAPVRLDRKFREKPDVGFL